MVFLTCVPSLDDLSLLWVFCVDQMAGDADGEAFDSFEPSARVVFNTWACFRCW